MYHRMLGVERGCRIKKLNCSLPKPPSAALPSIAVALAAAQSSALHTKLCSA